jgi:beta-1,4-mannosyltransferase
MSSTSWTADEDFSILLDALSIYEKAAGTLASQDDGKSERLPKLFVVITGKGPMKAAFAKESKLREERERWEWVRCRTAWLQTEDYPNLLGRSAPNYPQSDTLLDSSRLAFS